MTTNELKSETVKDDVWIPTACDMCFNHCGLKVHRVNGVVVKVEGNPDCPHGQGRICAKGNAGIMGLYNPNRVKVPLKRTNPEKGIGVDPKWVEIGWEEALNTVIERLKKIREDDPRKLLSMTFDIDAIRGFVQAFCSAFGTPNMTFGGATYFCGNALHPINFQMEGTFVFDPDLHYCNYMLMVGSQTGFMVDSGGGTRSQKMADARMRGMKLVVVDPICSTAAAKADEWLPIRPGTDGAFAMAMLNVLLNELGIYDAGFLKKYTNGPYLIGPDGHYLRDEDTSKPLIWDPVDGKAKYYDDPDIKDFTLEGSYQVNGTSGQPAFQLLKEHVKKYTCEEVAKITTIPAETIRRIAKEFGEAARIGSTIVIEGKELPYRPALLFYRRGVNQHKHAMLTCLALHLVNAVVGNIDMPGGVEGTTVMILPGDVHKFSALPTEGPDGLLVSGMRTAKSFASYPPREVKPPEDVTLWSLFPVSAFSEPLMQLVLKNPERFKLPYKIEALLHSRTNIMMCSLNPKQVEEWLKKIPFQVSFAQQIDETVEFADIVLPDTHFLERLDMIANREMESIEAGMGEWYYITRQPVVEPPPNVRNWMEVLVEIIDRLGILPDFNHTLSILRDHKDPYKLEPDKKYTWEEMSDLWAKSDFGPEHGLAWFKEHGLIKWPKKVEEAYPRSFLKPRIPIYLEHWIKAGEDVKRVTQEMGLTEWDVSDYQPLPDWKPCPAYEEKSPDYDLYPINSRSLFHTLSHTSDVLWLNELSEYHPYTYNILINSQVAQKKGIKDGDIVRLETEAGDGVEGRAKVTETVHPEVIGTIGNFGHWAKALPAAKGKGVHYQDLFPVNLDLDRLCMLTGAVDCCMKVKLSKIGE